MTALLGKHDPGGKVRLGLESGIESGAVFSECERYRRILFRKWTLENARPGYVLWIGMNPSTADATVDDPTVRKERKYTNRWGYAHYVKCNVMDYRATKPRMLMEPGGVPCSPDNLPTIVEAARGAAMVMLAFGAPHKKLRIHGEAVVRELSALGIEMFCFAHTKDGLPVHPLYQLDVAEPIAFEGLGVVKMAA